MATYILEELPLLLSGFKHNGIKYQTMVYPTAGVHKSYGLASVVYDIQTMREFASLKKEILEATCTEATTGIVVLPLQTQDDGMSDATKGS